MTVAPVAARVVASEAAGSTAARSAGSSAARSGGASGGSSGAGKVATGAGLGQMLDGGMVGRGAKSAARTVAPPSHARRLLVAEFTLCMVVLAFSPLTDKHKSEKPGAFMKRASATMGVFFILGLIATAGRGAGRAAAGFGGLVALVLLISQRSIFTVLTAKMGKGVGEDDGEEGDPLDLNDSDDDDDWGGGKVDLTPLPPKGPLGNGIR